MTRARLVSWGVVPFLFFGLGFLTLGAAPPGAVEASGAAARVNGRPLRAVSSLATGDRVTTGVEGSATLRGSDWTAQLGHRTIVAIIASGFELRHGFAMVSGSASLREGPYRIKPLGKGQFEAVLLADGRAYLHAIRGSVALSGFSRPITVAPGTAVTYRVAPPQEQGHRASDQPPPNHTVVWVAVAAAGAAAVAAGLALGGKSTPASPTQP